MTRYEYHINMINNLETLGWNKKARRLKKGILQAIQWHKTRLANMTIEEGLEEI